MHTIISEDADIIAKADIDWKKMAGKTVLIAGATGYVPQNFVHGFLRSNDLYHEGIKVIALCRSEMRAKERFGEYFGREDFKLLLQDVCEPLVYEGQLDFIIHAASPAGIRDRYKDYLGTWQANVVGSSNLLEAAKKHKASFLLVSSVDVYGKMGHNERLEEDMTGLLEPLEPRNIYSNAKRASETMCMAYAQIGVGTKIVRPFQILGSGISLDDGRLHADFIKQMLQGDSIVLKGDGTPKRTFMYVTDAIIGMLTVMLEGKIGEVYNLVWEENEATVFELAQMMARQVEGRKISIEYNLEARKHDPAVTKVINSVCGSSVKLQSIGWRAKVSLPEACRRMMVYYGLPVV